MTSLSINERDALPDALRVLVKEYPREAWDAPSPFQGLIRFWLEKHLMFRKLLDKLDADAKAALDGGDPDAYRRALARFGGLLVNELHGHHQIEDMHYFPVLQATDPVFAKGLEILDADHHALDGILHDFTDAANGVLQERDGGAVFRDKVAGLHKVLIPSVPMLQRHFEDEEDLVVPVLLKHEPDALKM